MNPNIIHIIERVDRENGYTIRPVAAFSEYEDASRDTKALNKNNATEYYFYHVASVVFNPEVSDELSLFIVTFNLETQQWYSAPAPQPLDSSEIAETKTPKGDGRVLCWEKVRASSLDDAIQKAKAYLSSIVSTNNNQEKS